MKNSVRLLVPMGLLLCVVCMNLPIETGPIVKESSDEAAKGLAQVNPEFGLSGTGQVSVKAAKEIAYYGMADMVSVREIAGFADYLVCSHALWSGGETIVDNVRYLHDHGTKVILDLNWWDVWPFPGVVNGWPDMYKENVVYGMNATESVKYRVRGCISTIGVEYVYGVTVGEEEGPSGGFPGEFIAWYMNLFYDWLHTEYPGLKVFQWPSPWSWILEPSCRVKADGIVVDDYDQALDNIDNEARLLKESYPDADLMFFVSASENFGWFTAHTPTYLKQAVDTVLRHAEVVGFWVTDRVGNEGWETHHWMYNVSLDICDQIHAHSFNTMYADTVWFPDEFGNDSVTESTSDWYASSWKDVAPDPSLAISTSSDRVMGTVSVSLSRTDTGSKSFWWQPLTHEYGLPVYPTAGAYGVFNLSSASRIRYFVKGLGWNDKTNPRAYISIEKYNSYFKAGNLTLPDISSLLLDGDWHEVIMDLPLGPESYYEWDGYASQLRFVTDYTSGSGSAAVLFDGFEIQAMDAGKILNLTTTLDCAEVVNGTLTVRGQAYVEKSITAMTDWYYHVSGNGSVSMCINGSWVPAPEPGTPIRSRLTGFRLYGGSFDYITINLIPPIVSIQSPHDGDHISGPTDVEVSVQDASGISWVEFQVDGLQSYLDTTSPYSWIWDTTTYSDGAHLLNVTAQSANGTTNFDYCTLVVDNSPPVVLSISPANNSAHHGVVIASINVSDSSGVGYVEFWVGGTLLKSDSSSPYDASIDTSLYDDGYYNLEIASFDTVGNSETTCLHLMFDNSAPQISLLSINKTLHNVTVAVNATDRYGIDRVEFYLDGQLESVVFTTPYSCTLENLTQGNHVVVATAYSVSGMERNTTAAFRWDILPPEIVSLNLVQTYDNVTVSVDAWDIYGVDYVRFLLDDFLVLTDYSYPYSCTFAGISDGAHTVTATICSVSGISSSSVAGFVWHTSPPEIIIDSLVETLYNVTVHASAQDVYGVERVEFWLDGIKHTVDHAAPFSCCVIGLSEGEHTVVAFAVSMSGLNSSTSATFGWVVLRPTVSIQDLVVGLHNVTLIAEVTDPYGIDCVEFYLDGSLIKSDSLQPYECLIEGLSIGQHLVDVVAKSVSGRTSQTSASFEWLLLPPTVHIASFLISETECSLTVDVSDIYGVENVQFWLDGHVYAIDDSVPYGTVLIGLTTGNHTLVAWAFSESGLNSSVSTTFLWRTGAPQVAISFVGVTRDNITVLAIVTDAYGVSHVDFAIDGVLLFSDSVAPYMYTATELAEGDHNITVAAYSFSGLSSELTTGFLWDMSAPVIDIESFAVNETAVLLSVVATDDYGMVRVEFWLDGLLISTLSSPPYLEVLTDLSDGSHKLVAWAFSVSGLNSSVSTTFFWTTGAPQVTISFVDVRRDNITVLAIVTDAYGIDHVDFAIDGVLLFSDSVAPYTYTATGLAEGYHNITVTAHSFSGFSSELTTGFLWDMSAPVVEIESFAVNETAVLMGVTVADDYGVERVEFWLDGLLVSTLFSSPYNEVLTGLSDGSHMLVAWAFSVSGLNSSVSSSFVWQMNRPTLRILSIVVTPYDLTIESMASDEFGLSHIEFWLDGICMWNHSQAVHSYTLTGLTDGGHSMTIVAYSTSGQHTQIEYSFDWHTQRPNAGIESIVVSGESVAVTAHADDIFGVDFVQFYLDGIMAFTDYAAPFCYTITDPAIGIHSVLVTVWSISGYRANASAAFIWDVTRPYVSIVHMQQNATCVTVQVGASDVYGVERIELWLDGMCIWNHTGAACCYVLETPEEGGHTFRVIAFSVTGRSSSIESSFEWHVAPPEIHSLSLLQGTNEVWVSIDATDVNDIEYVQFWLDNELYGTDTTSPFECTLSELAYGQHVVDVIVHSSSGKNATSQATFSWALLEPQIELTSVLETSGGLWVAAAIEDRFGLSKVEFFIDGNLVETLYEPPFACWFVALAEGNHTVVVKAYNIFDLSSSLEITILWDLIPPHLSLTSPIRSLLAGSCQLALEVYDISGVQSVEFLIDGMLVATLTGAPYTWTMNTTLWPDGNHTVLIRAIDRRGNARTLTLSVLFDNSPPVLTLLEPADELSIEGPAAIVFRVAVADLSPLDDVLLSYHHDTSSWTTIEMVLTLDGYCVSIQANPSDRIEFRFACNDSLGNVAVSDFYSVDIVDTIAPTVSIDSWQPLSPVEGQGVSVRMSAHDATGIGSVILHYRIDGTDWVLVGATEVSGFWVATIPGQISGSLVEFYGLATDTSNNTAATQTYTYTVSQTTTSAPTDVLVVAVGAGLGGAGTVVAVIVIYSLAKKRRAS